MNFPIQKLGEGGGGSAHPVQHLWLGNCLCQQCLNIEHRRTAVHMNRGPKVQFRVSAPPHLILMLHVLPLNCVIWNYIEHHGYDIWVWSIVPPGTMYRMLRIPPILGWATCGVETSTLRQAQFSNPLQCYVKHSAVLGHVHVGSDFWQPL
jgi:hypothetical protein